VTAWRVRGMRLPEGEVLEAGITDRGRWTLQPVASSEPLPGRFVLPGLVAAHCHLSVAEGADGLPVALDAATARRNIAKAREAGVTAIRDTGSPDSVTLGLIGTPDGIGLHACGRFLAPEAQYFPGFHQPVPVGQLVDAALAEVAAGARWVKVIADFPIVRAGQPSGEPSPTYPLPDIRRLIDAVHAVGARVAAHATTQLVTELIAAGVDSIEHGTRLDENDLAILAERGGTWTPTLCAAIGREPGNDPEREKRRQDYRDRLRHLLPAAAEHGVTIMTGTDVVGAIPREVALLAELGLPPSAALAAASTAARRYLGFPSLDDTELVDLVSYDDDPRDDPAVLARPAAVFLRGRRVW
jgi:imidazolonepropionase-like amidohydrolase